MRFIKIIEINQLVSFVNRYSDCDLRSLVVNIVLKLNLN